MTAVATAHIRSASTLARNHITVIVDGTSRIAIARRTTILTVRQSVRFRHALVTVFPGHQSFAHTLAGVSIATRVVDGAENVTRAAFTTIRITSDQIPKAFFADITLATDHIRLAMARTGFDSVHLIVQRIANTFVQCTTQITVTCYGTKGNGYSAATIGMGGTQ